MMELIETNITIDDTPIDPVQTEYSVLQQQMRKLSSTTTLIAYKIISIAKDIKHININNAPPPKKKTKPNIVITPEEQAQQIQ